MQGLDPLIAEINLAAVRHNLALARRAVGPAVRVCPVIKADAYGHGVGLFLPELRRQGVERVAVATLAEAVELRELGWPGDVLVFGRPVLGATEAQTRELAFEAVRHDLSCTAIDRVEVEALAAAAVRLGRVARVHVKIDTGMTRAGLLSEAAVEFVGWASSRPGVRVAAVYTHFATSEDPDTAFMARQLAAFRECIARLAGPMRHAANTGAIFRSAETHFDMVRMGLGLYGYWPDPAAAPPVPLRPCLRLVSRLVSVKSVPAGSAVGYGGTFVAKRPSVLGLVPIGYADGYLRSLSNRAVMTLRADSPRPVRVPVAGRVSMDQTILDLTDVPSPAVGEAVVVIDDVPGAPNSVSSLACLMNTIAYEVTCGLGRRVRRLAVDRPAGK